MKWPSSFRLALKTFLNVSVLKQKLRLVEAINLTKSHTFLGNFCYFAKVSKSLNFLVKSFLGNFYRHLATFYWSRC